MNDPFPLSPYNVQGKLMVTQEFYSLLNAFFAFSADGIINHYKSHPNWSQYPKIEANLKA